VARIAERRLELAPDRTRLARNGYTYIHVVMIAGVIVSAVGDELVIAHPTEVLPGRELAALVGGPALYLFGHVLFRLAMAGSLSRKRLGGGLACLGVGGVGAVVPAIWVAALVLAVLATVIAAERRAGARRARRGELAPLEQLDAPAL
jgi:low temperature requirement protein LtrA